MAGQSGQAVEGVTQRIQAGDCGRERAFALRLVDDLIDARKQIGVGLILAVIAVALATPVVLTFLSEGRVPRLPTAVLATGMMLSAFLSFACGVILDTVTRARRELKVLAYLGYSAPDFDSTTFK